MGAMKSEASPDREYPESLVKDFYNDDVSKAAAKRLQAICQSGSSLKNTPVSHSKRRHDPSDEESLAETPPPKRKSLGGQVKEEHKKAKCESASPTPAHIKVPHKSTKKENQPKKENQEQTFIVKVKSTSSMSQSGSESPLQGSWLPDDDIEGTSLPRFFSAEPSENPAWVMGGPEATRQQYREIEALTERALAVKQNLEDLLKKYDEFGPLEYSDDEGSSESRRIQTPDPFAEGGSNNPVEIADDDVSQANSSGESLTESEVSSADDPGC